MFKVSYSNRLKLDTRTHTFVFTTHGDTESVDSSFEDSFRDCKYLCYGREKCPSTGRWHLQGIVSFIHAKTLSAVIKIFKPRYVAACVDELAADAYCRKDGLVYEYGTRPLFSKKARGRKAADSNVMYANVIKRAKSGQFDLIEEETPRLFVSMYRTIKEIKKDYMVRPSDLDSSSPLPLWVYGPTATGKSHFARHLAYPGVDYYLKEAGTLWWDGYQGQDLVIIEDIAPEHHSMAFYLKIWCDRYAFTVQVKGSMMSIRPKFIIVTSNYSIEDVFGMHHFSDLSALKRRFTSKLMDQPYGMCWFLSFTNSNLDASIASANAAEVVSGSSGLFAVGGSCIDDVVDDVIPDDSGNFSWE